MIRANEGVISLNVMVMRGATVKLQLWAHNDTHSRPRFAAW